MVDIFSASQKYRPRPFLILCDMHEATRSWLMVAAAGENATRLYFGSAVVLRRTNAAGERKMGFTYRALLGFHKLYSRALLSTARASLLRPHRNRRLDSI